MPAGRPPALENSRYLQDVHLPDDSFQRPQSTQTQDSIEDLGQAIGKSFKSPLDYPPIEQSLFAGDSVAIALQDKLANPEQVALAIVANLGDNEFMIVCGEDAASRIKRVPGLENRVVVHDPADENLLSMTGIDSEAAPVYINRILFDADVVIPVGFPHGVNEESTDSVYPFFSGLADRDRFETKSSKAREAQARLANSQLGTFWGVQLVIGPGTEVHHVVTGEWGAVVHEARQKNGVVWSVPITSDAEFVLATLETESQQQTWQDFCAAIVSADQSAAPGAPILICSELSGTPPRKIKKALSQQFEPKSSSKLNETLKKVADIVSERAIFLKSNLTQSATEELGLGFAATTEEIQRMVDRHPHGLLLRDAHRCQIERTE